MKDAPKSCVLRIPKGQDTVDPDWSLTFSDVTGGHEGAQLSYIADGKAVFAGFPRRRLHDHAPRPPPTKSVGRELGSVGRRPRQPRERRADHGYGSAWSPIRPCSAWTAATFLLAPGAEWETTQAYELLADGSGRLAFTIEAGAAASSRSSKGK